MGSRVSGELLPGQDVVQFFEATENQLRFLSVRAATYLRQNVGTLTLTLRRRLPDPPAAEAAAPAVSRTSRGLTRLIDGARARFGRAAPAPAQWTKVLARLTVPCAELVDCETIEFPVGCIDSARGDIFSLRIIPSGTRSGAAPTILLTDEGERLKGHVGCWVGGEEQAGYGIQAVAVYGGLIAETLVPESILYSPVSQCNLNCIHCISRHTRTELNRLPESIKADMQKWADAGQIVCLGSDYSGDLLWADHRFGGELDFLIGLGVGFHIDTNGTHLFPEVSERLCRSRMQDINISLDAAEEETFRRVRKGARSLREVTENIEALVRARAASGANFRISLSFTLMRSTLHEWPAFMRMAARLGVDFVYARHLEAYTPEMEAESLWHDQAAFNAARLEALELAGQLGVELSVPLPFSGTPRKGRMACAVPWKFAMILGNGDVAGCCVPGLVMGNLHENTMEEIWNGPKYQELRATVNSDNPKPTCATCPMLRRTDDPDSYLIYSALQRIEQQNARAHEAAAAGG